MKKTKILCKIGTIICGIILVPAGLLFAFLTFVILVGIAREEYIESMFYEVQFLTLIVTALCIFTIKFLRKYLQKKRERLAKFDPVIAAELEQERKEAAENEKKMEEEQARAYIERQNKKYTSYKEKKKAAESKKVAKSKIVVEATPKDEHLSKVYRIGERGKEFTYAKISTAFGITCFVLAIIVGAACEPYLSDLASILILTALSWALLLGGVFIGILFRGIYNDSRFRVYLKSQSGELYYCQLFINNIEPSYSPNKIARIRRNSEIALANETINSLAIAYYNSDEFSQQFENLIRKEAVKIKYEYTFEHLPNAQIIKRGKLTDTLVFTEKSKTHKIKVHRSFCLD